MLAYQKIDREECLALSHEGWTDAQLAERYRVAIQSVQSHLRKSGIETSRRRKRLSLRKTPSQIEIAYIAGLFDGEGCVFLTGGNDRRQIYLSISISQKSKKVLEFVRERFGVGHIYTGGRGVSYYTCKCREAMFFLETVLPYLIVKKEVSHMGIDFQKNIGKEKDLDWKMEYKLRISMENAKD